MRRPGAEKIETNMVGYFLQGSGKFFVPRELVGHLEPTAEQAAPGSSLALGRNH